MKDQINTIREALKIEEFICTHGADAPDHITEALTALTQLEAMVGAQEPFGHYVYFPDQQRGEFAHDLDELCEDMTNDEKHEVTPLYTAAPVAQQPLERAQTLLDAFKDCDATHAGDLGARSKQPQATCKTCGRRMDDPSVIHGPNGCCPAQQPQAEPFGYVSQHTNGTWEFSPTPAGVYPDTAKSITAVYAKQPQAEAFQPDWVNYRQGLRDGWAEGYEQGIADERISEANIGIAGFGAKVNPARENPYKNTAPQQAEAVPTVQIVNCDTCKHSANSCDDYPCNRCGVEFGDGPFNRWAAPQQAEVVPDWVKYDATNRILIIKGQRYAEELFDHDAAIAQQKGASHE